MSFRQMSPRLAKIRLTIACFDSPSEVARVLKTGTLFAIYVVMRICVIGEKRQDQTRNMTTCISKDIIAPCEPFAREA